MKKYIPLGLVILAVILGAVFLLLNNSSRPSLPAMTKTDESPRETLFMSPKKSAHYESNTPEHGAILAGVPINVVINFNFDLAKPSSIEIHGLFSQERIGPNDYGVGETIIDSNKLSMRRQMQSDAPDGKYSVAYKACWPDGSCHDGNFQFAIDKTKASTHQDMTGKTEVTITMSQIRFIPMNVKVSKGTKITWINDDEVEHYVNTDSHPAHTYYPDQNSKALKKGDSYSLVFATSGIYPYHCSAHADLMTGSVLVE